MKVRRVGKPKQTRATAWSYSRLGDYEKCPQMAKFRLDKLPEPPSPAMERGSRIHEVADLYVQRRAKWNEVANAVVSSKSRVPEADRVDSMEGFKDLFMALRRQNGTMSEVGLGLGKGFQDRKGWMAHDVWVRARIDVLVKNRKRLRIIDFKTGKFYRTHEEQAGLYAAVALSYYPEAEHADVEFWYLDSSELHERTFHRNELEKLVEEWTPRAEKYLAEKTWKPTPSTDACRFCPFHKTREGPCEAGV